MRLTPRPYSLTFPSKTIRREVTSLPEVMKRSKTTLSLSFRLSAHYKNLTNPEKISYEIFSKVVHFFQKIVTKISEGATRFSKGDIWFSKGVIWIKKSATWI